jgi:hypothetical protein
MIYQLDLTDDEIKAVPEALAWMREHAPAGLPMTPATRAGILILKRLEGFAEKFPGNTVPSAPPEVAAPVAPTPEPVQAEPAA